MNESTTTPGVMPTHSILINITEDYDKMGKSKPVVYEVMGFNTMEEMFIVAGNRAKHQLPGTSKLLFSGELKEMTRKNVPSFIHMTVATFDKPPVIVNVYEIRPVMEATKPAETETDEKIKIDDLETAINGDEAAEI